MAHDEITEELDEVIKDFDQKYDNSNPYYKALRAIVELHRPTSVSWANGWDYCMECSNWEGRNRNLLREYPCSTIEAIEKELR